MKFYDMHTSSTEEKEVIKIEFEDGRQGIAIHGNWSGINAFNFVTNTLSRVSIGGTINTKTQSLEQAVKEYNDSQEQSIMKPNRITHAVLA